MERKTYPQGDAWKVDLSGKTITKQNDGTLGNLDHMTNWNLSGSTITDDLMTSFSVPHSRYFDGY